MAPLDTSAKAAAMQLEIQRRLSPGDRLRIALEMSETARALALGGLRVRFPNWTAHQLQRELLRQAFSPGDLPVPLR